MIKVYFESNSSAELVAIFKYDEDYNRLSSILELIAKDAGYTKVTESIENGEFRILKGGN